MRRFNSRTASPGLRGVPNRCWWKEKRVLTSRDGGGSDGGNDGGSDGGGQNEARRGTRKKEER